MLINKELRSTKQQHNNEQHINMKVEETAAAIQATLGPDKQKKTSLVIETIQAKCSESTNLILEQINYAINDFGATGKLKATVLSGGWTNYSYRVYLDKDPDLCVFAKLSFESASWNPDKTARFDLVRTQNEYNIMKQFSEVEPDNMVSPLACWDVEQDGKKMKLIVSEWSKAEEQLSNQFIEGSVDPRIAPKLAHALASLHTMQFDPNFNDEIMPYRESMLGGIKSTLTEMASNTEPKNRTETYCSMLGKDVVNKIIDITAADDKKRECFLHRDPHTFNLLVEAKSSVQDLQSFGENGHVIICDWEMAGAGPHGIDVGIVMTWPVACMVAHTLSGKEDACEDVATFLESFLSSYLSKMMEGGLTQEDLTILYRRSVAWCGWFCFSAFHVGGCFIDASPCEDKEYIRDAMGVIGLQAARFYDYAYLPESTPLDELKDLFRSLVNVELKRAKSVFTSSKRRRQSRKCSLDAALMRIGEDSLCQGILGRQLSQ
jgi:thiamine kinase-like enzyme